MGWSLMMSMMRLQSRLGSLGQVPALGCGTAGPSTGQTDDLPVGQRTRREAATAGSCYSSDRLGEATGQWGGGAPVDPKGGGHTGARCGARRRRRTPQCTGKTGSIQRWAQVFPVLRTRYQARLQTLVVLAGATSASTPVVLVNCSLALAARHWSVWCQAKSKSFVNLLHLWPLLLPGKISCLPLPLPPSQLLLCHNAHRFATHCRALIHGTIFLFRIWPSAAFPSHFVVFFFPSLFAEGHLIWPLLLSRPLAPNPSLSIHKPQIIFHVRTRITVVRHAWQRLWPRR